MARPLTILSFMIVGGVTAGVLLTRQSQKTEESVIGQKPAPVAPKPPRIDSVDRSRESQIPVAPPQRPKEKNEPPCGAPMKLADDGAPPDFSGIGIELVRVRELQALPMNSATVPRAEVQHRIAAWLAERFPADFGKRHGRALAALGAIPEPVDTIALRAEFWSHQIGAWFDEKDGTLYLAEPSNPDDRRENALGLAFAQLLRAHGNELLPKNTVALTTDAWLARLSLLAGDAALTRLLHSVANPDKGGGGGVGEDPDDPSRQVPIPAFQRELELAPFSIGLDFARSLHSLGKFEQVDAAYGRPPVALIEVLEPSLYLGETQFKPEPVKWNDLVVNGVAPIWDDALGAPGLVLYLRQYLPQSVAADVAAGWRGDRWIAFDAGEKRGHVALQTIWQDANAADAFFAAMRQALLNRYKGAAEGKAAPQGLFKLDGPQRFVALTRTHGGRGVFFADAGDAGFATVMVKKFSGISQEK